MLIRTNVRRWRGPSPQPPERKQLSSTNTQEWVLNTKNMFNVQDKTSYRALYYVDNLFGIRSHGNYLEVTATAAEILTAWDATFQHEYIALPVYEDDDTATTAVTRYIPVEHVSMARADGNDATRSYLWYCEGSVTQRVLVDYPLADIVYLADEGSTTSSA